MCKGESTMNMKDYEIREVIRKRLIECRKEKGLSQAKLAEEIGSNPTTVASWEQPDKALPHIETLYQLSKYYGKSIGYMYGESDD